MHTVLQFKKWLQEARHQGTRQVILVFAKIEARDLDNTDIPQFHFDQLRHVHSIRILLPSSPTLLDATPSEKKDPGPIAGTQTSTVTYFAADQTTATQSDWTLFVRAIPVPKPIPLPSATRRSK